jgi:acyl-coenzyme A synthetase/AMP-(fatty) acid ligase
MPGFDTLGEIALIALPETFNVATYFVDRNVLEGRGQKIAIECGDQKVSYQELLNRTNQVGNALRRLGVRPEERVQLLLEDVPEFLYCFFGTIKIGAVAVPTNTLLNARDYEYLLNNTRARVVFVSEALLPQLQLIPRERLKYLREIVVVGSAGEECLGFAEFVKDSSADLAAEPTRRDDAALWLYSSGSTGFPKGCVHLHHDMVVCSELYAKGILKMSEQDRCYSVARLFFAYGLGNAGYFPLACGATSILSPGRPTPRDIYANIERCRPTLFSRFRATTRRCWLSGERMDRSLTFPACGLRSPPAKPCLRLCFIVSNSGSSLRSWMVSAQPNPCIWLCPTE